MAEWGSKPGSPIPSSNTLTTPQCWLSKYLTGDLWQVMPYMPWKSWAQEICNRECSALSFKCPADLNGGYIIAPMIDGLLPASVVVCLVFRGTFSASLGIWRRFTKWCKVERKYSESPPSHNTRTWRHPMKLMIKRFQKGKVHFYTMHN